MKKSYIPFPLSFLPKKIQPGCNLFAPCVVKISTMRTGDVITRILPLKDNLFRIAFRITGDAELSRRIVRQALLKVWSQRETWIMIEDLPAYCLMVTRHLALDTASAAEEPHRRFAVK